MPNTNFTSDRTFMLRDARYKYVRVYSGDQRGVGETNSSFVAKLYNDTNLNKVREYTVHSACVPNVFNNLFGQKLAFNWVSGGPFGNELITVPDGYYSTVELMAVLKTTIDPLLPIGSTITFNQDSITNLISYTLAPLATTFVEFESFSTNPLSTMSPLLGINTTTAIASTGTFDAPPALAGEQFVYINSQTLNLAKTRLSNGLAVSTFVSMPVNVAYGQNIYFENSGDSTNDVIFNSPTDISNLSITLRAQDGRILQLPDNHNITIILKVFY